MNEYDRLITACKGQRGRSVQRLKDRFSKIDESDRVAIVDFLESVPVTETLVETVLRVVDRNPVFIDLSRWLRFMEQHYAALLESPIFHPRLNDVESIECVSGLLYLYSYFPDRVFAIAEEVHIMLCTRALVGNMTDAKVNINTGHQSDRFIALADYMWLDFFLERVSQTAEICRVLDEVEVRRIAEVEAMLDTPDIGTILLDGAL